MGAAAYAIIPASLIIIAHIFRTYLVRRYGRACALLGFPKTWNTKNVDYHTILEKYAGSGSNSQRNMVDKGEVAPEKERAPTRSKTM